MTRYLKLLFAFLASYGFACVIFLLLLVLTFLGTLAQVDFGLYNVQRKYFESIFFIHWAFGVVPIPLPGAYLLLVLFTINLISGGIIRMRKGKSTIGNLIIHSGMLLLIAGGGVKYWLAQDGHLTFAESQVKDEFESYFLWEVAIGKVNDGKVAEEYLIPNEAFVNMTEGETRNFTNANLPFDITLEDFTRNSEPRAAGPQVAITVHAVEGFYLEPLPLAKEAENNIAGTHVLIKDKASGESRETILWGFQQTPYLFQSGDATWSIDLRKKRYALPFGVRLDKFTHEQHPRTDVAKLFRSDVTQIEGGGERGVKITMNAPLRDRGYTLYQASWVPADPQSGRPIQSTLAVVNDPADRWPLYSCFIVTAGLLIHFCGKLIKYLRRENRRMQPATL